MAKSANQKSKLLYLSKILLEQTDEDHPITVPEMIQELAKRDIKAERKSIYDDLETLSLFGLDVQSRKGRSPGWFIGSREFDRKKITGHRKRIGKILVQPGSNIGYAVIIAGCCIPR